MSKYHLTATQKKHLKVLCQSIRAIKFCKPTREDLVKLLELAKSASSSLGKLKLDQSVKDWAIAQSEKNKSYREIVLDLKYLNECEILKLV